MADTREYQDAYLVPRKLKEYREREGLSLSEVARAAGMQGNVIGWIESGRFTPYQSQLLKIAAVFGITSAEEAEKLLEPLERG